MYTMKECAPNSKGACGVAADCVRRVFRFVVIIVIAGINHLIKRALVSIIVPYYCRIVAAVIAITLLRRALYIYFGTTNNEIYYERIGSVPVHPNKLGKTVTAFPEPSERDLARVKGSNFTPSYHRRVKRAAPHSYRQALRLLDLKEPAVVLQQQGSFGKQRPPPSGPVLPYTDWLQCMGLPASFYHFDKKARKEYQVYSDSVKAANEKIRAYQRVEELELAVRGNRDEKKSGIVGTQPCKNGPPLPPPAPRHHEIYEDRENHNDNEFSQLIDRVSRLLTPQDKQTILRMLDIRPDSGMDNNPTRGTNMPSGSRFVEPGSKTEHVSADQPASAGDSSAAPAPPPPPA